MRIVWTCLVLAGCALTTNKPPLDIHYFSPELGAERASTAVDSGDIPRARLRLGRVDQVAHLRYRIVQRTSDVQLALYETRRWTEHPDAYVRRALSRALFEDRPIAQTFAGGDPTLDVEVLAYDEVLAPSHVGRVRLRYVLHDRTTVLARGEIAAEHPVVGPEFTGVVHAIGRAMHEAASRVADAVTREICPEAHELRTPPLPAKILQR
jgi:cholesterol transport system auxiliary component